MLSAAVVDAVAETERGRELYARRAWADAFASLSRAARAAPDLELLATSAYMLGRDADYFDALERAHHAHLDAGDRLRAAYCALWMGVNLMLQREVGPATGWIARAQRLVDREGRECVERGYLLIPAMFRHEAAGDLQAAAAVAGEALAIGDRFGDRDLFALAAQSQGTFLVMEGEVEQGVTLLDEAMVAVSARELSPIVSGLVYCGVILGCQAAYDPHRAHEWTTALSAWCEQQPDMVAFTGRCLTHRAELMWLHGAWPEALEEARRAGRRSAEGKNALAAGEALYVQGEVLRRQGELAAAEEAYRTASRSGREPQPGLALLRLAQGDTGAAAAAIRRALDETSERPLRARLLPAVRGDHARGRRPRGGARGRGGAGADRRRPGDRDAGRDGRARARARSSWPPATPGPRSARRGTPRGCGSSSRRRSRWRRRGRSSGWPAARSATATRPRSSSRPRAGSSPGSPRRPSSRAWRR